jgi:predicted Zn-dependent protease
MMIRRWACGRAVRAAFLGMVIGISSAPSRGQDAKADPPDPRPVPLQEGDDIPAPFVPAHPRTVGQRDELGAIQDYAAARAKQKRRQWNDAIKLLDAAREKMPDSAAVFRQLSRINLALGRVNRAISLGKDVLRLDPSDTQTLQVVVGYYQRLGDNAATESVLEQLLANPKLVKGSASEVLARRDLGLLLALKPETLARAADSLERTVQALDERDALRLTQGDLERILGDDPADAYRQFAAILYAAGRLDGAEKALRRGLTYKPDDDGLTLNLAEALQKAGKSQEALATLEPLLAHFPEDLRPYSLLAEALISLKREGEILPRLEKAAEEAKAGGKGNVALQAALADRYVKADQGEKAKAIIDQLSGQQGDASTSALLGELFLKARRTDDLLKHLGSVAARPNSDVALESFLNRFVDQEAGYAAEVLKRGIELVKEEPPGLPISSQLALEKLSLKLKDVDSQLTLGRLAVKRAPDPEPYLRLVYTLSEAKKPSDAGDTVEEMLKKFPEAKNPRILAMLAQLRIQAGQKEAAAAAARDARALDPNSPEIGRLVSFVLSDAGQLEDAIAVAREVANQAAGDPANVATLCYLLTKAGHQDEALAAARDALAKDDSNPELNALVGDTLQQLGKDEEAVKHFEEVQRRFANNDEIALKVGLRLSAALVKVDQIGRGERVLEGLLEKFPEDPTLNNDLGYLYADQGKELEKAEKMIRLAIQSEPENTSYLDSLGWVLFKRGKLEESLPYMEKAVANFRGSEGDATLLDHLGDVYFQLKKFDQARETWKRAEASALKSTPPDKRVEEIRRKFKLLEQADSRPAGDAKSP